MWPFYTSAASDLADETNFSKDAKADVSDWEDWTSVATTEDRLFHAKKLFTVHVHAIDPTIALLPARNREFSARSNSCCS